MNALKRKNVLHGEYKGREGPCYWYDTVNTVLVKCYRCYSEDLFPWRQAWSCVTVSWQKHWRRVIRAVGIEKVKKKEKLLIECCYAATPLTFYFKRKTPAAPWGALGQGTCVARQNSAEHVFCLTLANCSCVFPSFLKNASLDSWSHVTRRGQRGRRWWATAF